VRWEDLLWENTNNVSFRKIVRKPANKDVWAVLILCMPGTWFWGAAFCFSLIYSLDLLNNTSDGCKLVRVVWAEALNVVMYSLH
jgi:hypothetical protein